MEVLLPALLNGLAHASTLFLMAAGLTLIFGVTRIVNFAHGSFYMLGALVSSHVLVDYWPAAADSPWTYALVILLGALAAATAGALAEFLLLRRLYSAPELYQLVATFGLSLFLHDALLWALGPDEVFAPRFPGLKGAFEFAGNFFPSYQLLTLALGPLVWLCLHLLLTRTQWGTRLRAAAIDRDMLSALGVSPSPLLWGAVVLGCGLAGLGGALQLPREPANLQMDVNMVVETFVVVVTGGLGSLSGAFGAAVLIGLVHAVGALVFPSATPIFVFATMGVVLTLRPYGLRGHALSVPDQERGIRMQLWPKTPMRYWLFVGSLGALVTVALLSGLLNAYWQSLLGDILIMVLFAVSLQSMMALGGLVSFGQAAFFGLGALLTAWAHTHWAFDLSRVLLLAILGSGALAALCGWIFVRSSGVYLAMLSLALAQVVWAGASQWDAVTGGDNGLIGLHLVDEAARSYFLWGLAVADLLAISGLRFFTQSAFGAALQASRDAPQRAIASGLPVIWIRFTTFVASAMLAGLAGSLFAAHKGAVFPSVASVATSVDVLMVILLGGLHQLWGSVAGAAVLELATSVLGRDFNYWRGALGLFVMLIMVFAPSGLLGRPAGTWIFWRVRRA